MPVSAPLPGRVGSLQFGAPTWVYGYNEATSSLLKQGELSMRRSIPGKLRLVIVITLSLGTLLYLSWFLMRHYRGYAGVNEPFSHWQSPSGQLKVWDGGTSLALSFPAYPCGKCAVSHFRFLHCQSTIVRFLRQHGSGTKWGPFYLALGSGGQHYFFCDYWVPLAVLGFVPGIFLAQRLIRKRRDARNRCVNCDYDLTGNTSSICPECGEKIELA